MGTSIDYSTVAHETIYRNITGGLGGTEMLDASQGWQDVAAQLREIQVLMDRAVREIGVTQQGAAADAAIRATMALLPWVTDTAMTADAIASRVDEQAAVFAHTRGSMPPPRSMPEMSFTQDPETRTADHAVDWLPGMQIEHERAQVAAQQDEQRARDLMSGYQDTSNEILALRQRFTAAPPVLAEVAAPGLSSGYPVAYPAAGYPSPGRPAVTRSATSSPAATSHFADSYPADSYPADSPFSDTPSDTVSPQLAAGYSPVGEQPVTGSSSVQPVGTTPVGPSPMLVGAGGAGSDRSGGFGPRPAAAFGAAGSPVNSALARSRLSSSGPRSTSREQASGEHANAGRPDRTGAGFADAALCSPGRSGDRGDTAHRRPSYLLEQDSSAIVGELPLLAPPVIGAEQDYQ